jgi:hypothetical protein
MTTRRGFLRAMLAAAAAPAIVRAESLMPIAPRIWTPPLTAQTIRDITAPLSEYVVFCHPSMYEDMYRLAAVTGEATLYRGELYSYGVRIIPNARPPT